MSRTPETHVKMRSDGAVLCNHRKDRGRCNKLLLTPQGEVRCPNGDLVSLREVSGAYLGSRQPHPGQLLGNLWPSWETMDRILDRIIHPGFKEELEAVKYRDWIGGNRLLIVWLITVADRKGHPAAAVLRKAWEEQLRHSDNLVWRYLRRLYEGDENRYRVSRERALLAYGRTDSHDPLQYLHWSPIELEAAQFLGETTTALYAHNLDEARGWWAVCTSSMPVYFGGEDGSKTEYWFNILLDPEWRGELWSSQSRQLSLRFRHDQRHAFKWHLFTHFTHPDIEEAIRVALDEDANEKMRRRDCRIGLGDEVLFFPDSTDHVNFEWENQPGGMTREAEVLHLAKKLRSVLNVRLSRDVLERLRTSQLDN